MLFWRKDFFVSEIIKKFNILLVLFLQINKIENNIEFFLYTYICIHAHEHIHKSL